MINFKIFGYSITIRKPRKPHPMNTQAYHRRITSKQKYVVEQLKAQFR